MKHYSIKQRANGFRIEVDNEYLANKIASKLEDLIGEDIDVKYEMPKGQWIVFAFTYCFDLQNAIESIVSPICDDYYLYD